MHYKLSFTTILIFSILMIGCEGSTTTSENVATNTSNNANKVINSNNPLETTKKPEAATTNGAPTLGPVVQVYFNALKAKDDAAVSKVLSQEYLKKAQAETRSEKKAKLTEYLAEYDGVPEKPVEVRNEKINGDNGVAEVRGANYVNWTAFGFVKEGGVWKLSGESPETEGMKPSGSNK